MSEKRTCEHENAQPSDHTTGAGVRHSHDHPPRRGGGYLKNYTIFQPLNQKTNFVDPRLDELRKMGLSAAWQRVASEIGFDNFLKMWRVLDSESKFQDERYGLLMNLRRYSSYLRYQRATYILNCHKKGLNYEQITQKTNVAFCEKNTKSYICNSLNYWYKNKHE